MQKKEAPTNNPSEGTKQGDLLVPPGFSIDVTREMEFAATSPYPGYPSPEERLHMSSDAIAKWIESGGRTDNLPQGNYTIMNHANYLRGLSKGAALADDGKTDFSAHQFAPTYNPNGYKRDERGLPIRPYDDLFLQKGAIAGFGFYYTYGPNRAADPVVFRQRNGKLQSLLIERVDTGLIALPGGMQDPEEPEVSVATRELFEEAGVDLRDTDSEVVHQGIVWSDTRSTRNAWAETTVVLLLPDASKTDAMKPKAGDDARKVRWVDVSEKSLKRIFMSHASFIKLAVLAWQRKTGLVVTKSGKINLS